MNQPIDYNPDPSISRACRTGQHPPCDGVLVGGIGDNWWCTCTCHPEPAPIPLTPNGRRALKYFREQRARRQ